MTFINIITNNKNNIENSFINGDQGFEGRSKEKFRNCESVPEAGQNEVSTQ